jgi:hypothetical protein
VLPVKYQLGFYIPEGDILHGDFSQKPTEMIFTAVVVPDLKSRICPRHLHAGSSWSTVCEASWLADARNDQELSGDGPFPRLRHTAGTSCSFLLRAVRCGDESYEQLSPFSNTGSPLNITLENRRLTLPLRSVSQGCKLAQHWSLCVTEHYAMKTLCVPSEVQTYT